MILRSLTVALALICGPVLAQDGPLRIDITEGVIEPMPFAVPDFVPENAAAQQLSAQLADVVAADLTGTGLFREVPEDAFISAFTDFGAPVAFSDWKAINVQALVAGAVAVNGDQVTVKFRLYDVATGSELGQDDTPKDLPRPISQRPRRFFQCGIEVLQRRPQVQKEVRKRVKAERNQRAGVAAEAWQDEAHRLSERAVFPCRGQQGIGHHVARHRQGEHPQQREHASAWECRAGGEPGQRHGQ